MEPIDRSTVWPYDEHGEPGEFVYQRYAHPTGAAAERALGRTRRRRRAALRVRHVGGHRLRLRVLPSRHDGRARRGRVLRHRRDARPVRAVGAEDRRVRPDRGAARRGRRALARGAREPDARRCPTGRRCARTRGSSICDATVATPVFLHALDEGADVALHSATKYLTGHSNAMLGATVTRDPSGRQALLRRAPAARPRGLARLGGRPAARARDAGGAGAPPDRDGARPRRAARGATRACSRVRYPGFGGLIAFDVADGDARAVETATKLIANADEPRRRRLVDGEPAGAGRATGSRAACCGSRSASRTSRRSGPTSRRRSTARAPRPRSPSLAAQQPGSDPKPCPLGTGRGA